jgi:hypothetical protein
MYIYNIIYNIDVYTGINLDAGVSPKTHTHIHTHTHISGILFGLSACSARCGMLIAGVSQTKPLTLKN